MTRRNTFFKLASGGGKHELPDDVEPQKGSIHFFIPDSDPPGTIVRSLDELRSA